FADIIFLLMVVEVILILTWNSWYYRTGIVVLRAVRAGTGSDATASDLRPIASDKRSPQLRFKEIGKSCYAFRETPSLGFKIPYLPVMRGVLTCDRQKRTVEVKGLFNLSIILLVASPLVWTSKGPEFWIAALFAAWAALSYAIQRTRFRQVATEAANHAAV